MLFRSPLCLKRLSLKFSRNEVNCNATLMWLNKSTITINPMFKILDITSLRFIYIFNKFGFRLDTFNPNRSFPST